MTIFVYDDDISERDLMICHIKSYYYGRTPQIVICAFGSDLLTGDVGEPVPDLALICQDGDKGIETARHFREFHEDCTLVLISDTPNHGLEAYDLRAAHYLVKPVGYSQLCQALTRCENQK